MEAQGPQGERLRVTLPHVCAYVALASDHASVCMKSRLLGKVLCPVKDCLPVNSSLHMPMYTCTHTFTCAHMHTFPYVPKQGHVCDNIYMHTFQRPLEVAPAPYPEMSGCEASAALRDMSVSSPSFCQPRASINV